LVELSTLAESGRRPNPEHFRSWLWNVSTLTKILSGYRDKESLQQLTQQRQTFEACLTLWALTERAMARLVCTVSLIRYLFPFISSRFSNCPDFPKHCELEALQFLASSQEIDHLAATLHEQLVQADPNARS
jgi:hypothetical protein